MEDPTMDSNHNETILRPDHVPSQSTAADDTAAAVAVPSMPQPVAPLPTTAVDGQGMWRAWTRVFEKPSAALLDLLDNSFDAALHADFQGRVVMDCLLTEEQQQQQDTQVPATCTGITIMNNSKFEIKSLEEALTVYKSTKNAEQEDEQEEDDNKSTEEGSSSRKTVIGENGVGLKHGCATLSDTSFVLTRNHTTIQVGVIAKSLQSVRGVYLPSFTFELEQQQADNNEDQDGQIYQHINDMIDIQPRMGDVLAQSLGEGELHKGITLLAQRIQIMSWSDDWQHEDHVFQLLLCHLHHLGEIEIIDVDNPEASDIISAKAFLDEIQAMLPEYYINIPSTFDFRIDGERIHFSFWQHRLVELTHFPIHVPKENNLDDYQASSDWIREGYPLNIYCGFDAQRVDWDVHNGSVSPCMMYIYSRQAGRLIKIDDDARLLLNLCASGSDYMQGLTIIIDDYTANLPLQPTKDGIAWSENRGGDVHRTNLLAWAGAVAQCFWKENFKKFDTKSTGGRAKLMLKRVIRSFAVDQLEDLEQCLEQEHGDDDDDDEEDNNKEKAAARKRKQKKVAEEMANADFNRYENVRWRKDLNKFKKLVIRRVPRVSGFNIKKGSDTLYEITPARIEEVKTNAKAERLGSIPRPKKQGPRKRKYTISIEPKPTKASAAEAKSKSNNNKNDDDNVDSTEVAGKRQRRSRSTPIQYTDPVSDQGEDSEDLIEYTVPVRKSTRKRKATRKAATRRKKSVTDVADDDSDNEAEPVAAANPDTSILEQKLLESDILLKQEQLRSIKAERALQEGKDLVAKLQAKLERYQGKPPPPGYQPDDDSTLREELNRVKEERNSYKHRLDARIDQGARVQELYRQNKLLREQLQEQGGEPMSVLLKRVDKLEARIKRRDMTILKLEQAAPNDTLSTAEPVAAVSPEKATDGEIIQSI
ncbi:expressed unknown protein [Seminavis robusta]|uniref:Uncharacterized protein n=1 Tax=Seminavis robusta TaxID=568900 RepID=A0A9N8EBJ3_9STRA|nr:expressed unknown protein [Seminavis robusta]|eukprot:Sro927_g221150.1 n/a (930) ;mRNA; r:23233-26335